MLIKDCVLVHSLAVINIMMNSNLGKKGWVVFVCLFWVFVCLFWVFVCLFVFNPLAYRTPGREVRTGTLKAGAMGKRYFLTCFRALSQLFSFTTQAHLTRDDYTHSELGLHTLTIKKMLCPCPCPRPSPHNLAHWPTWWRHFFIWGSFVQVCQVDNQDQLAQRCFVQLSSN